MAEALAAKYSCLTLDEVQALAGKDFFMTDEQMCDSETKHPEKSECFVLNCQPEKFLAQ